MPRFFIGVSAVALGPLLVLVGCGETSGSKDGGAGGGTSHASGADAAGVSAGQASGGNATAGSNTSAGAAGGDATGASTGSAGDSGSGSAGAPEIGGEGGGGAGEGLVSCDPKQTSCKMPPGECPVMQVRAVVGACWGDCVEIDQCACNFAAECPDSNQYTCWMGRHCGPYVN